MVLRIDKSKRSKFVIFSLSGRIEQKKIVELQQLFASLQHYRDVALDLRDVTLVDKDSVEFLARCQAEGIELWNCPTYLAEWIVRIRAKIGI